MSVVDSGSPSRQNAATDILFDRRLWGREEAFSGFLTLAKVKVGVRKNCLEIGNLLR